MRLIIIVTLLFAFSFTGISSAPVAPEKEAAVKSSLKASFSTMPLSFTENQGQWPDSVLYRASAGGATMWFTPTGAYYQFTRRIPGAEDSAGRPQLAVCSNQNERGADPSTMLRTSGTSAAHRLGEQPDSIEITMVKAEFVGSNSNASAMGLSKMDYKCNYFIGNEPDKWRTDVSNYESIQYQEIYPGIDLKYYGNGKQIEYDFIVSPGADYSKIQIRYDGAESISIGEKGELIIKIANGEIIEQPPIVYQMIDGHKVNLEGQFFIGINNTFSFAVDSSYNHSHALIIDPVLVYSSYLGGSSSIDNGFGIAVDVAGAAYVTGETQSANFPTLNPYQTYLGYSDVFVSKLNSAGNGLVYSTYLGGSSGPDRAYGIAVDAAGAAYVAGSTSSTDFPTFNPYQGTIQGTHDAFVTKLSSTGNSLVYSTYLGGSSVEFADGITVDASETAYVVGRTFSTNFPTLNPYQGTNQGDYDIFVTKLSSAGNSLVYSTYLGGSGTDGTFEIGNITVDAAGAAYVTGVTTSTNFPTFNQYQTDQGGWDAFVTKLSSSGNSLVYSTYLGGSGNDYGQDIAVDAAGAAYVAGYTSSTNFPTLNPYQGTHQGGAGIYDAFVTKLSNAGNSLVYSTYLGDRGNDFGYDIAVDAARVAYVTGSTESTGFPTLNWYQEKNQGNHDVFVTNFSAAGNSLIYSTYLGGNDDDYGYGIAVDAAGVAYVTGKSLSTNFPTLNPYQGISNGSYDVFVTKLGGCCIGNRGDFNNDGTDANILDLTFIVDRIFRGGRPPACPTEADVNSDGSSANILDLTFLADRIFRGGAAPGPCL